MNDQSNAARVQRFLTALDLFESGVEMKRTQLRRQHPEASEAAIDDRLMDWLLNPSGAKDGDCPGRVIEW